MLLEGRSQHDPLAESLLLCLLVHLNGAGIWARARAIRRTARRARKPKRGCRNFALSGQHNASIHCIVRGTFRSHCCQKGICTMLPPLNLVSALTARYTVTVTPPPPTTARTHHHLPVHSTRTWSKSWRPHAVTRHAGWLLYSAQRRVQTPRWQGPAP